MVKLKQIQLQNYCGYKGDISFDFTKGDKIKNFCAFYGPNGFGKSKMTKAIDILCNAKRLQEFSSDLFFRKLVFNKDYIPGYEGMKKVSSNTLMVLRGIFDEDGVEKIVEINSKDGVIKNELPYKSEGHCLSLDADHPLNMNKFQLHTEMAETFLDIANAVYGFKCELDNTIMEKEKKGLEIFAGITNKIYDTNTSVKDSDLRTSYDEDFHTDFTIYKDYLDATIHYKSMSDGEKKIATMLRQICDPNYINNVDIIVIDNLEQHIYFKRHLTLVNKLMSSFPDKQFFITTHSSVLVEKLPQDQLYDIEEKFYSSKEGVVENKM